MSDYSKYINNIISEYESINKNTKIIWIDVPFAEGEKRTLASILSDNPPDLINLNPDFSAILAQKGVISKIPQEKLEGFNKEIIETSKYNNDLYIIPWYATSAITIYNKDIFDKLNLPLPTTYDDIASLAYTIKSETNKFVSLFPLTENDTMLKILNKYGINSYTNINSSDSIKVFDMFKTLYQKNLLPSETITQTHLEALEKYMAGEIIFFQSGANFLNMIKENAPEIYNKTDVLPQLKGRLGQNDFSLMNFVIPEKSKNKEIALDFCLYLTNSKNQLELAKLTNILSTRDDVLNDNFYNDYTTLNSKARSISAKQLFNLNPVIKQSQNQKEINNLINTAVQSILLNKSDTKSILDTVSKEWEIFLK